MFYQVNDARLSYAERGAGIPLLCLPAFPFDGRMYREQWALSDTARVIVPDYRGTGQSELGDVLPTMEQLADDMVALLDHLGIARAVVLGVSMGDYVAFAMYAKYPERFEAFIIADTRPEADAPATAERRRATVDGLRTTGTSILHDRVNDLFAATTRRERPELVAEMQAQVAAANPEGLARITLGIAQRADSTPLLSGMSVPTILLCGEEDTVSPPDGMRAMAERIPGHPPLHLIPHAGHLAPLEQPTMFNGIVREFLVHLSVGN